MERRRIGRGIGIGLALLAVAGILSWAQGGDTPIVILDGSLTMQSAVPGSNTLGAAT